MSKRNFASSVQYSFGQVLRAQALLETSPNGIAKLKREPCRLVYRDDDDIPPYVILDMGPQSTGGYPCFEVTAFKGNPTLRIAYSNWLPHIMDETFGPTGDCLRRYDDTYLKMDLPILPGNPDRHELYGICRTGLHTYPLLQGQTRWVRIQLDTPGTSIDIEDYYLCDTDPREDIAGSFSSSDSDLDSMWQAGAYCLHLASIANSHAWDVVEEWLAPRYLDHCGDTGLSRDGADWTDYTFSFECTLLKNPNHDSRLGWTFRAPDRQNGYVCRLDLNSNVTLCVRTENEETLLHSSTINDGIKDGQVYRIDTTVTGDKIAITLDGNTIIEHQDSRYSSGRVGFVQSREDRSLIRNVAVQDLRGNPLIPEGVNLDLWDFKRSLPFISDGALRDRMPWLGDMFWAAQNAYVAFADQRHVRGTIAMLAHHQTPDGHIWATAFPQCQDAPAADDYGLWPSDEFSMWFGPLLADYHLFTDDLKTTQKFFPVLEKSLEYAWKYVDADGFFNQRQETSNGQRQGGDFGAKEVEKSTYTGVLLWYALTRSATLASSLEKNEQADEWNQKAETLKRAVHSFSWNSEGGYFTRHKDSDDYSYPVNALALATGIVPDDATQSVVRSFSEQTPGTGKMMSLAATGCFIHGYDFEALEILRSSGKSGTDCWSSSWVNIMNDARGIQGSTWESCIYPPFGDPGNEFRDMSHPDTAVAHLMSLYVLGIRPLEPGFQKFVFDPHPGDLKHAAGRVPTLYGKIEASWSKSGSSLKVQLTIPKGMTCLVSATGNVLSSGTHEFDLAGV
jgi:hypothetical protein